MRPEDEMAVRECSICPRADRDWIETLMAAGVFFSDLRVQFGVSEIELRRHETLHSTKQPSIDPLNLLREMRWLSEQAQRLSRREMGSTNKLAPGIAQRRNRAIMTHLAVVTEYSKLINAPKHLDSHVVLPRWHQVILKLSERLKGIPGAVEALAEWAKEEGPQNTGVMVKTPEVEQRMLQERMYPSVEPYYHQFHTCLRCQKRFRCHTRGCQQDRSVCQKCINLEKEIELKKALAAEINLKSPFSDL